MKKCNIYFQGEAYDSDTIISIEMVSKVTIKINMKNERRHYFSYGMNGAEEARSSYNELMALYDKAVETRKKERAMESESNNSNGMNIDLNSNESNNNELLSKADSPEQKSSDDSFNEKISNGNHDKPNDAKPANGKDKFIQETLF